MEERADGRNFILILMMVTLMFAVNRLTRIAVALEARTVLLSAPAAGVPVRAVANTMTRVEGTMIKHQIEHCEDIRFLTRSVFWTDSLTAMRLARGCAR